MLTSFFSSFLLPHLESIKELSNAKVFFKLKPTVHDLVFAINVNKQYYMMLSLVKKLTEA